VSEARCNQEGNSGGAVTSPSLPVLPAKYKQKCQLLKDQPDILPGGLVVALAMQKPTIQQLDSEGDVSITGLDMASQTQTWHHRRHHLHQPRCHQPSANEHTATDHAATEHSDATS
jgi:hypothetical protein